MVVDKYVLLLKNAKNYYWIRIFIGSAKGAREARVCGSSKNTYVHTWAAHPEGNDISSSRHVG